MREKVEEKEEEEEKSWIVLAVVGLVLELRCPANDQSYLLTQTSACLS